MSELDHFEESQWYRLPDGRVVRATMVTDYQYGSSWQLFEISGRRKERVAYAPGEPTDGPEQWTADLPVYLEPDSGGFHQIRELVLVSPPPSAAPTRKSPTRKKTTKATTKHKTTKAKR